MDSKNDVTDYSIMSTLNLLLNDEIDLVIKRLVETPNWPSEQYFLNIYQHVIKWLSWHSSKITGIVELVTKLIDLDSNNYFRELILFLPFKCYSKTMFVLIKHLLNNGVYFEDEIVDKIIPQINSKSITNIMVHFPLLILKRIPTFNFESSYRRMQVTDKNISSSLFYLFENISHNRFELLEQISLYGFPKRSLEYAVKFDDLDLLKDLLVTPGFRNARYIPNFLEPCSIISKANLIQMAACFGSIKCFKYLSIYQKDSLHDLAKYSVVCGNSEIIHLVEQTGESFENALSIAIMTCQNDIAEWIFTHFSIPSEKAIQLCRKYNNHAFEKAIKCITTDFGDK